MNDHLENELRAALAHIQPPYGFVERVAAKLPDTPRPARRHYSWLAAVAAIFALLFVMRFEQVRQERQKHAAEVRRQLTFALRLTAEKLTVIDTRLRRSATELQIGEAKEEL
jgi:hypothetical protein